MWVWVYISYFFLRILGVFIGIDRSSWPDVTIIIFSSALYVYRTELRGYRQCLFVFKFKLIGRLLTNYDRNSRYVISIFIFFYVLFYSSVGTTR